MFSSFWYSIRSYDIPLVMMFKLLFFYTPFFIYFQSYVLVCLFILYIVRKDNISLVTCCMFGMAVTYVMEKSVIWWDQRGWFNMKVLGMIKQIMCFFAKMGQYLHFWYCTYNKHFFVGCQMVVAIYPRHAFPFFPPPPLV